MINISRDSVDGILSDKTLYYPGLSIFLLRPLYLRFDRNQLDVLVFAIKYETISDFIDKMVTILHDASG